MASLPYKLLNQRHDTYDADCIRKLQLLLEGGFEITRPENAELFIKKFNSESHSGYKDRVKCATYQNNFGEIINDFGASVFAKPLLVVPATDGANKETPGEELDDSNGNKEVYMELQTHFTLEGHSASKFMHEKQTESNALSRAYFGVDFEEKRPYAYHIDPTSVLDWQKDERDDFIFLVLRDDASVRTKVSQERNSKLTTTFIVWTKEDQSNLVPANLGGVPLGTDYTDNSIVKYEVYRITYSIDEPPTDETMVPLVESMVVDFKQIPIIECCTPDNLSVGKIIGQLAASSFVRYTSFLHALNRSAAPILAVKQGAEMPANGDLSVMNEDEARGEHIAATSRVSGAAVTGPDDLVYWAEVKGDSLKIYQEQLTKDKNEMYRLVSQLGSIITSNGTGATTTKASGTAKQIDNKAKENMLNAYAELVKSWVKKAFDIIFSAKNFEQNVIWQVKGMDNYQVIDEDQLIARIIALPSFKENIPSKTCYKQACLDTASDMHSYSNPGTLSLIREEIISAIDKMGDDEFGQGISDPSLLGANGIQVPSQVKKIQKNSLGDNK